MIQAEHLTKRYGETLAVDDLTFGVEKGEVLGLLGPNGAGKTTTMRMLTCFMPPSAGRASVAGFDVFENSLEVRRRIGYMPETTPLYNEMRVNEYLSFRAKLKGVPGKERRRRIDEVLQRCGLEDVRRRIVGQLSKGYRQRVGLAEALVNNPPVLILDEPTIGLDPNQIRQVRSVIRDLADDHTVILSTHILPEVEIACGRVIIIDKGQVVAMDTPENLRRELGTGGKVHLELRAPGEGAREKLLSVEGVTQVTLASSRDEIARLMIEHDGGRDVREDLFRLAAAQSWPIREVRTEEMTLEDIFVRITSRRREEAP